MRPLAIATTTFSKSMDMRARLALKFAQQARKSDAALIVVDGGSPRELVQGLKNRGALVYPEETKGMGASRRQAMRIAAQEIGAGGIVLWSEAEKVSLPTPENLRRIGETFESYDTDLVIPARTPQGLASYPPLQAEAEIIGNLVVAAMLNQPWRDYWFGPFAANALALKEFLGYDAKEYGLPDMWESIQMGRLAAMARNYEVKGVVVNYMHPPEQTAQESTPEFAEKRVRQLRNLVSAFALVGTKLGLARIDTSVLEMLKRLDFFTF